MTAERASFSLHGVARSALILTGGSVATQLVSIARELFVAAQVGLSRDLDAVLISLVLPISLAGVLTSGTVTALVPAYLDARATAGRRRARLLAGAIMTWVVFAAIALMIALVVFAPMLIDITGPGLDSAGHMSAESYLQLLAPMAPLAAVAGVLTAICQAEERFRSIAIATFVGPATTLLILVVGWQELELTGYVLGSLAGSAVTTFVLVIAAMRASILPVPTLRVRGLGLRTFAHHAWPLTVSAGILQLNVVADRAIASLLAPGAVSALRYGEVLVRTPISAIAPAWGAAMYPTQVRATQEGDGSGLAAATMRAISAALAAFIPTAVLFAALAPLAVAFAYGRGAFGVEDIALTSTVVAAFAPLIVVLMVSPVLAGAHNARRRGFVLLATGAMNVVLNFALDVALGAWLGVAGIALSSSVTSVLLTLFLAWRLELVEPAFHAASLARSARLALTAIAAPAGLAAIIAWSGFGSESPWMALLWGAVLGFASLVTYVMVASFIGLEEVRFALGWCVRATHRLGRFVRGRQ